MSKFNQPAFIAWCQVNLPGFKHDKEDRYLSKCPLHCDTAPSLRIFGNTAIFLCFGRCAGSDKFKKWFYHAFCREAGLKPLPNYLFWGEPSKNVVKKGSNTSIEASYFYVNESGEVLFRVDRLSNKLFPVSRYDPGSGLWLPGTGGAALPLYHLDELANAQDRALCVFVEGEKDAEAAKGLGYLSTTKAGGAKISDLTPELLNPLTRFKTVVIPDNDSVGINYALAVVSMLLRLGGRAVLLPLPGVENVPGGDLSDFIEIERRKGNNPSLALLNLISLTI